MKKTIYIILLLSVSSDIFGSGRDSTILLSLPDTVRAVQYYAVINNISGMPGKKEQLGISASGMKISLTIKKSSASFHFEFPKEATIVATGLHVNSRKNKLEWNINSESQQTTFRILLSAASDSAENFTLYSGYVFSPSHNKWKLLGTCKVSGRWFAPIQEPRIHYANGRGSTTKKEIVEAWCQRRNGSWKSLQGAQSAIPLFNLYSHVDSIAQRSEEEKIITNAIAAGTTDARLVNEGVHYTIMEKGKGRYVSVEDTVIAFYKGYLFSNGEIFDQTKDKPATFHLKRLIKGWQIGLPLCQVGCKIKLVIPSDLAYSIRTRAAKIPPNSILVFEIEIIDTKPTL